MALIALAGFAAADIYIFLLAANPLSIARVAWRSMAIAILLQMTISVSLPYCARRLIWSSSSTSIIAILTGSKFRAWIVLLSAVFVLCGLSITLVYTSVNCPEIFLPTVHGASICPGPN